MKSRHASVWALVLVLSGAVSAAAVDHAGASYELRPSVVNGGGSGESVSASYSLTAGVSEIGQLTHDSTSFVLLPSFTWTYARPSAVTDLAATALGSSSATLTWTAPHLDGERGDLTQDIRFLIQYATGAAPSAWSFEDAQVSVSTSGVAAGSARSLIVTGLGASSTFQFRLWTVDMHAGLSEISNAASTNMPAPAADDLSPAHVPGFAAAASTDGVHLSWSHVTMNEDRSPISDLWGYRVLRSSTMGGAPIAVAELKAPATSFFDAAAGGPFYYQVQALDLGRNQSVMSQTVTGENAWRTFFSSGGVTASLENPAAMRLLAGNNASGRDLRVKLTRHPERETGSILRAYTVDLVDAQTEESVPHDSLQGEDINFLFGYGAGGIAAAAAPADLALYHDNGAAFIPVVSGHDRPSQSLTLTSSSFGDYQIRQAPAAAPGGDFSLISVRPRMITPNGDGRNDMVFFFYDNPRRDAVRLRILNLSGARVAEPSRAGATAQPSLVWDGRDNSGRKVPSGAYVYVLEGGRKRLTGTVVVVR